MSKIELSEENKVIEFVSFCVENVALYRNEAPEDTYCILRKSGLIENYIIPAYEALHTQSKEYIVRDLMERMNERKL